MEFKLKSGRDYIGYLVDLSFPPCRSAAVSWAKSDPVCRVRIQGGTLLQFDTQKQAFINGKRAQFARSTLELYLSLIHTSKGMRKQLQLLAAVTVNHDKSVY